MSVVFVVPEEEPNSKGLRRREQRRAMLCCS
jgi:hypothetical protein